MQAWPLSRKIQVTQTRIMEWYMKWENQVYISFSGGKDSTVLADMTARICKVHGWEPILTFVDTGLEYPEIRDFVDEYVEYLKSKYGIEIDLRTIKPKMTFNKVIQEYGIPFPSKEVSKNIYYGRKAHERGDQHMYDYYINGHRHNKKTGLDYIYMPLAEKWKPLFESDIKVSNQCCYIMKKEPAKRFEKETGLHPIIGEMADDSKEREMNYLRTGCNGFDSDRPISKPMGFWTEQDVLKYIRKFKIPICSVYGDVVYKLNKHDKLELKLTGVNRTGCMFCLFGIHLQEHPNKFEQMRITHPKQYDYCLNKLGCGKILDLHGISY